MTDLAEQGNVIRSSFRAASWLGNRHLQTLYPSFHGARAPRPALVRRMLDLPDGDVTAVDWLAESTETTDESPLLVILHGLEGSAESTYARYLLQAASDSGWHAAVLHFRDCGDYRNVLPRRYHAGETNDLRYFINKLRTEGQQGPIVAAGYSLGGNVLLKYLGEDGATTPLHAAAAVSVPLDLGICSEALTHGFSKVYQYFLLKRMKIAVARKFDLHTAAFDWTRAMGATTFAEFDDAVTAPLHGFAGRDEYYEKCSSIHFLRKIDRPTLIINSRDDPFMLPNMLPAAEQLSKSVLLEISEEGGHVGFVSGGTPWNPQFYLPQRIVDFLRDEISKAATETHALPGM
ncbi:MAG: hydrolase [Gammaproteobacteria bacterium]|nr:hydrolase [Gammaproteobacteria bacterium]